MSLSMHSSRIIKSLLFANRSEIAICVIRLANALRIRNVTVYAEEDKSSLHRLKADEGYQIGKKLRPVKSYLSIDEMI